MALTDHPATRLLGRCADCKRLVLDYKPHEWANAETNALCWPSDAGARLYCGDCSNKRCHFPDVRRVAPSGSSRRRALRHERRDGPLR